jgi:sugar-specific transcriptional regulator TrmB
MSENILENIGLTPNEAKIYKSLLELKEGTIWNISSHSKIHRRNTYDAIQRLIDKGLSYQVLPKKTLTYAPVHPEKLKEFIEEKQQELEKTLPGLISKFNKISKPQEIYIYKGVGGLKNFINLILKEKSDIYGISSKGTWFDPRISIFAKKSEEIYRKLKIKTFAIYDEDMKMHKDVLNIIGGEHKFLNKKYSGGSSVDIFGDYVAVYSGVNIKNLEQDINIFIMKDKTLAEDYRKWWQFMWDNIKK